MTQIFNQTFVDPTNPDPEDKIDACGVEVETPTDDANLPAATGGVA